MKSKFGSGVLITCLLATFAFSGIVFGDSRQKPISLSFESADIRTVLRTFAELGKVNIVASEKVKGRITLRLRNVPWEQAFLTVLRVHGLTKVEEEGIIGVLTMAEREAQKGIIPLETKIFRIKYATAEEINAAITSMLTNRGGSTVDERTNSVIVTDIPSVLNMIDNLLNEIDSPTPQVMIEAKIVELDYKIAQELGIEWYVEYAEPTSETHIGGGVDAGIVGPGQFVFGKLLSGVDIESMLKMLESEDKAEILSQPKIAVLDNEPAMIMSGKRVPVITMDEAGNQIVQFYDVALKLNVTPHINPEDQIMLELHPEVSDLSSEATVAGGIIILTNEAKTKLMVNNGQTAVIGGILRNKTSKVKRGIPFLSRIPLLGNLFGSTSTLTTKSELMIFVTPYIIPVEKK